MKNKLMISSIFAVILILTATISSAGALDLGTAEEEPREEVVNEECPLCAVGGTDEGETGELGGIVSNPPSGEEPPCYPCHEAVIRGLADSKDAIVDKFSAFPKVSNYIGEVGWIFHYINDIGVWLNTEPGALVQTIIDNLAKYNFSGADIVGQAAIDGAKAVLNALKEYASQLGSGNITLPIFVLVVSTPVLVAIFTTYFTVSLFMHCLGLLLGGGDDGPGGTSLPGATEVTMETTESTTSGTMSL